MSRNPLPSDGSSPSPLSILYVEDHADTREAVGRLLNVHGYPTTLAATYRAAIEAAEAKPRLDVLIADLKLPDGDGADLFVQLRRRLPNLIGLCLSASGQPSDVERCLALGFRRHIVKPIHFDALQAELRAIAADLVTM